MRFRFYFVAAATILFFSTYSLQSWGQERQPKPPVNMPKQVAKEEQPKAPPKLVLGGFETEGSVTVGYRFTTIKGDRAQYDDLLNLHQGFRLMDVSLTGRAPEGSHLFADSYLFTASGLGGDPYPGGQLVLRKDKLYDLRVNYRQSYYYWNENNNDSEVLAGFGVPVELGGFPFTSTHGLTANHGWATVRRLGSVNLNLQATNSLRFNFDYDRNSRDGMAQTTRNLYYPGNPNSGWGQFSTANPYLMAVPIDETADRITGGVDYTLRDWIFHYRAGYQSYFQNMSWSELMSPEQSINTDDPNTSQELLTSASWVEFRRLKTPVSEFSYNGNANSWLELRGSYNYYNFFGPGTEDATFIGDVRSGRNSTDYIPYTVSVSNLAHVGQQMHDVSQGFTAKIKKWWNFNTDYRYYRVTSNNFNELSSVYNDTVTEPERTDEEWRVGTHWLDLNMELIPATSLVIRAGMRYVKRDAEQFTNGEINDVQPNEALNVSTQRTKDVSPTISVFYRPVKMFSVRGDYRSNTTTRPYTRISPHTDQVTRFILRFQPTEKVSVEDNFVIRNSQYETSTYRSRYRSNAINVFYNPFYRNWLLFDAGFSYESIFGTIAHVRASSTTPFDGFWQDAFINRAWRGGLIIKPTKRSGIDLSGNYLRTTGASQLYSTVPAPALDGLPIVWPVNVGPLTFPMISGTFYYDFPKVGRLSVDLQRAYYAEEIVHGNDFQSNFLTIKWTKNIGHEDN